MNFYKREDVSRVLPQKRYATKHGPGSLMQKSIKQTYAMFLEENSHVKICYSKFARLKPPNVRLLTPKYREYCVCVYCINIRYKVHALRRVMKNTYIKEMLHDENSMLSILLCPKADTARYNEKQCIENTCQECGSMEKTLRTFFSPDSFTAKEVTWCAWKKMHNQNTGKVHRLPVTRRANISELVNEFVNDIVQPLRGVTFIRHLFNAQWQYRQFFNLKENLPTGFLLQVMDFAKNRSTVYEEEIKGAFFAPQQITMHPIVSYYSTPKGTHRHSLVFFSEDNNHDYHAVEHYTKVALETLKLDIPFNIIAHIIFSDGCAAQYKSAGPLADVSFRTVKRSRNYFGSEHGKGDGDGEVGIVNRALDRAICAKEVIINNAYNAYDWCKSNLAMDEGLSKRDFIFVRNGDINRMRPYTRVKTLPGTRKIHQVENIPTRPGYNLRTRNWSCFCISCTEMLKGNEYGTCRNKEMVGQFHQRKLKYVPSIDGLQEDDMNNQNLDEILNKCEIDIESVNESIAFENLIAESIGTEIHPDNIADTSLDLVQQASPLGARDQPVMPSFTHDQPVMPSFTQDQPVMPPFTQDQPVDTSVICTQDQPVMPSFTQDQPVDPSVTCTQDQPVYPSVTCTHVQNVYPSVTCIQYQPVDPSVTCTQDQPVMSSFTQYQPVDPSVTCTQDQPVMSSFTQYQPVDPSVTCTQDQPVYPSVTCKQDQPVMPSFTQDQPVMPLFTKDQPVMPSITQDQPMKFQQGTYICVSHGNDTYPAVVQDWPYVRFFTKHDHVWSQNDLKHSVCAADVVQTLDPPDLIQRGFRLFYSFKELN